MADSAKVQAAPGCLSVEVDGERYPVRDGHATVTGPRADELLRVADAINGNLVTFRGPSGGYCLECRRQAFAWETVCPGCGGAL